MRHVSIRPSEGQSLPCDALMSGHRHRADPFMDRAAPEAAMRLMETEPAISAGVGFCAFLGVGIAIGIAGLVVAERLDNQIAEEAYHYDVRELVHASLPVETAGEYRERARRVLSYLIEGATLEPLLVTPADTHMAATLVSEHHCLTKALYYEARGESVAGRLAVGEVIANRVQHKRFPDTICGVVYQGAGRRTGCQFSFTCDGSMRQPTNPGVWRRATREATHLLLGLHHPVTNGATHYHADYVKPVWAGDMLETARIGSHLFYRSKREATRLSDAPEQKLLRMMKRGQGRG